MELPHNIQLEERHAFALSGRRLALPPRSQIAEDYGSNCSFAVADIIVVAAAPFNYREANRAMICGACARLPALGAPRPRSPTKLFQII